MNGADNEPRRQLPMTAARENDCNATQVTSVLCRRWRPSRNRIFFAINITVVGYQFPTDFYSQNRRLCYRRSHGPLLCAFCFHFNSDRNIMTVVGNAAPGHIIVFVFINNPSNILSNPGANKLLRSL